MRTTISLLSNLLMTLSAQNVRFGEGSGKTLPAAPRAGAGTWEDPKRPAFVRESGVPFRYQVSDDGTMALVEASPRNLAEMKKLDGFDKSDARSKKDGIEFLPEQLTGVRRRSMGFFDWLLAG